jgi:ribonuclease HI
MLIPNWHYHAYTDGGCRRANPGDAAWAFIVYEEHGSREIARRSHAFPTPETNNHAEYMAIWQLLNWAAAADICGILVHSDSQLVVNQLTGKWQTLDPNMERFKKQILELADELTIDFKWVPRELNKAADALVNECMDAAFGKRKK